MNSLRLCGGSAADDSHARDEEEVHRAQPRAATAVREKHPCGLQAKVAAFGFATKRWAVTGAAGHSLRLRCPVANGSVSSLRSARLPRRRSAAFPEPILIAKRRSLRTGSASAASPPSAS